MIIVTGGAGFIGSNFIIDWFAQSSEPVVNIDKLTYAGHLKNLEPVVHHPDYYFIHDDINHNTVISDLLKKYQPRAIIHFAAESHVDRSITGPADFIQTNIIGTFNLLEAARKYHAEHSDFKFLHVSTDEVYGSLNLTDPAFSETHAYQPNSPYSASKASSDHLVRAYFHTYGLPVLTTNCSNNYGPRQLNEKLIPLIISNCLQQKPLPIYGDGSNIRDWLYVSDHCSAIRTVLEKGRYGEVYNIGGNVEKTNLEIVNSICDILDQQKPAKSSYKNLITFVKDRPGHDKRYAINSTKIQTELQWQPAETFETGIAKTLNWYINHA